MIDYYSSIKWRFYYSDGVVRKDHPLNNEKLGTFHAFHFLVWFGVINFHIFTTPFEFSSRHLILL
jgi:hypothetical protein